MKLTPRNTVLMYLQGIIKTEIKQKPILRLPLKRMFNLPEEVSTKKATLGLIAYLIYYILLITHSYWRLQNKEDKDV
jgi:hypothetical protein